MRYFFEILLLSFIEMSTQSTKTIFFKKMSLDGFNTCIYEVPSTPVKTWASIDSLTSAAFTRHVKECCFYCLQDPYCKYYQIVRLNNTKGFCYIYNKIKTVTFMDNYACKSFIKTGWLELTIIFFKSQRIS